MKTLEQLLIAEGPLLALGQPVQTLVGGTVVSLPQAIPLKAAYHVSRLLEAVQAHTKPFRTQQDALMVALGEKRPPTDAEKAAGVTADAVYDLQATGQRDEFNRQIVESIAVTVTMDKWLLTLDVLAPFHVSPRDLSALLPLIVEPEEAPDATT